MRRLLVPLALGMALITPPPAAAVDPSEELIAFASNRDGDSDLFTMRGNGSAVVQIVNHAGQDYAPAWSPDGTKIAFMTDRDAAGGLTPLDPGDGNVEIYVMSANGSAQRRLTSSPGEDGLPSWSPDGSKIAFQSNRDGNFAIYVMNADGSSQERVTPAEAHAVTPAWSPDGERILFAFARGLVDPYDIYSMRPDGSDMRPVIENPAHDALPAWSPDGTMITFESDRTGNLDVFAAPADGSAPVQLTDDPTVDVLARWSPFGERIAFTATRDGGEDVYVMDADGSDERRLTTGDAGAQNDADPAYRPLPRPARGLSLSARGKCGRKRCAVRARGRLTPPAGSHVPTACDGDVRVELRSRGRGVARARMPLDGTCAYSGRVTVRRGRLAPSQRVVVVARFDGNHAVAPKRSTRRRIRL